MKTKLKDMVDFSDLGSARMFAHVNQGKLIRCGKHWYAWTGKLWGRVEKSPNELYDAVIESLKQVGTAAFAKGDYPLCEYIKSNIQHFKYMVRTKAMETFLTQEVNVNPNQLDKEYWKLNCSNGVLDLNSMKFESHTKCSNQYFTRITNADYNPEAKSPVWEHLIKSLFGGEEDLIDYVQQVLGSSLVGMNQNRKFYLFYGDTKTGKSTLLNPIMEAMGSYCVVSDPQALLNTTGTFSMNALAEFAGARLIITSEPPRNQGWDSELIKRITGESVVACMKKYEQPTFDYVTYSTIMMTNHIPSAKDADKAFFGRVNVIPFKHHFDSDNEIKGLKQELLKEQDSILNWLVKGCVKWKENDVREYHGVLHTPETIQWENYKFMLEADGLRKFFALECTVCQREEADKIESWFFPIAEMWESYKTFVNDSGVDNTLMSSNGLSRKVSEFYPYLHKGTKNNKRGWCGIKLKKEGVFRRENTVDLSLFK